MHNTDSKRHSNPALAIRCTARPPERWYMHSLRSLLELLLSRLLLAAVLPLLLAAAALALEEVAEVALEEVAEVALEEEGVEGLVVVAAAVSMGEE